MVIARGDCVGLPVQEGTASLFELKEHLRHGLKEQVKAVLALPGAFGAQWMQGGCAEHSTSESEAAGEAVHCLDTKLAACQALAEEAMGGASHAAVGITELLADRSPEVRRAAMEALICVADFGPRSAVNAAGVALRLSDPGLRWRGHEQSLAMAALAARTNA